MLAKLFQEGCLHLICNSRSRDQYLYSLKLNVDQTMCSQHATFINLHLSPSKSSSSSAIGWWRFHCFILRLCCWWFLTWWQASRNLSWSRSCDPPWSMGSLSKRYFARMFLHTWYCPCPWKNCSIRTDNLALAPSCLTFSSYDCVDVVGVSKHSCVRLKKKMLVVVFIQAFSTLHT